MNTKIIKLDLNRRLYDKIIAKQGDTKSRFLLFQLLDGSIAFNLTNRSVRAYMVKPDGKEIFNDLIINNYSLGYCTLELTNQVLAVPGTVKIELMVTEEDRKLTSSVFELEVIKSINSEKSIVSTNEFTALLNGLSSLSEYDNYKNEIAAARDGEVNLLTKVKKIDKQLEQNTQQIDYLKSKLSIIKLIANIDGTDYKKGDVIDYNFIKTLQIQQFSDIMRNFRVNKKINILTRGTSLTYGYDEKSADKREPSTNTTDTGRTHKRCRASKTYPEALKEYIDGIFGKNSCTIENIGYSGAWVKFSFDEYYKYRTNNLEIIEFGTNDSRLDNCPYKGDVKQFTYYYEQLIVREILMGNGLILLVPIQTRKTRDLDVETFRTVSYMLGEKYGIPVIDGSELLESYEYTIWSDETHLTGEGYTTEGYRIGASLLNKSIVNPQKVSENSILLMSPVQDSCYYKGDAIFYTAPTGYTPNSIDEHRIACRLNSGGELIYTFYAEKEGLAVLPSLFMYADAKLEIILNNKIKQAKCRNVHAFYKNSTWDGSNPSSITITNTQGDKAYAKQNMSYWFGDDNILKINNKGWHTLRLKNVGESAINLFGVEFLSSEDYCRASKLDYVTLFYDANGVKSGDIQLNDELINFNTVIIFYDFAGIGSTESDFKSFNEHNIRLINLSNSDGILTEYVGEMAITKKDEKTLSITRNKAISRNEQGVATLYSSNLISIKKIIGRL